MRDIKDLIAEVYGVVWANDTQIYALERLANLAREDEREACAKVCEEASRLFYDSGHIGVCLTNAGAIRARGQA